MRFQLFIIFALLAANVSFGQVQLSGKIVDQDTEKALQGAKITLTSSKIKAISDKNGQFKLSDIPKGFHELTVQLAKYEKSMFYTDIEKNTDLGLLKIKKSVVPTEIQCLANYSFDRKSAIAHHSIPGEYSVFKQANRDLPHVFENISSVYISEQGGGAGDSQIRIRGFNQENTSLMLNGILLNSAENGQYNWSQWEGLDAAATSFQLQKGITASPYAIPAAGGNINLISNPSEEAFGGYAQFQYGTANQLKTSFKVNSGLINKHFGLSFGMSKKSGDGIPDYTWNDALSIFGGATIKFNDKHKIEFFGFSASQRHGMNPDRQNIGALSSDLAGRIGTYDEDALDVWLPDLAERYWNPTGNTVSEAYSGKQFFLGKERERYASGFINEKENYSNKPLFSLNYHGELGSKLTLNSTFYTILGESGISGSLGTFSYAGVRPSKPIDFDKIITSNKDLGASAGILYNAVRAENTYGSLIKLDYKLDQHFRFNVGFDGRMSSVDRYDEVRDLLGGNYFMDASDEFRPARNTVLGDTIRTNQTRLTQKYGAFAQVVYNYKSLHSFFNAGLNTVQYDLTDHFKKGTGIEPMNTKTGLKPGFHLKAGASYNLNQELSIYLNGAYVSQTPYFENMIQPSTGLLIDEAQNQRFQHVEIGADYDWEEQKLKAGIAGYFTNWQNRSHYLPYTNQDGQAGLIFASGISQRHLGFELDAQYEPIPLVDIKASLSMCACVYNEDTEGSYDDFATGDTVAVKYSYYLGKLLVGGAPQTQASLRVGLNPLKGLRAELGIRYFTQYYADFDPFTRTSKDDIAQAWRLPGASVLDAVISYDLPKIQRFRAQIFGHASNLLNSEYVSDAADNSLLQGYKVSGKIINTHSADAAEVFLGMPFRFNLGVRVNF